MIERGKPADLLLLMEALESSGNLEKVGGAPYVAGLAQNTAGAANAHRYAEIVRDKAILRGLLQNAQAVMEKAMAGATDPRELAEEAEVAFLSVLDEGQVNQEFVHIGQAAVEYLEWID